MRDIGKSRVDTQGRGRGRRSGGHVGRDRDRPRGIHRPTAPGQRDTIIKRAGCTRRAADRDDIPGPGRTHSGGQTVRTVNTVVGNARG